MRTVEIPGGTATLRESEDLRAKDSDLLEEYTLACVSIFSKLGPEVMQGRVDGETEEQALARLQPLLAGLTLSHDEAHSLVQLRRAAIIACLDSWTLPQPVPTTVEQLGEAPRAVVQALDVATGGMGALLTPAVDFSPSTDPESPTPAPSS